MPHHPMPGICVPTRAARGDAQAMSGIVTRWPVLLQRSVAPGDGDGERGVASTVLAGWLGDVVDAVVAQCSPLQAEVAAHGATVEISEVHLSGTIAGTGMVTIGGGVTEIRARSLTVSAKYRPGAELVDGVVSG